MYYCKKIKGIQFVSMIHLGQNYLLEDKHSFQDTLNPICHGRQMLHTLSTPISLTFSQKLLLHEQSEQNRLSFRNISFRDKINKLIQDATIDYILLTKRFDDSLF